MAKTTLDLTGQWQFKEYPISARRMRDLDSAGWEETTVPSSIFNSLIEAGRINPTDIDTNPENFAFVSEKPWVYKKNFDAADDLLDCGRIDLVFEGLDTIASIWLNDKLIGKTNNMFIPFRFDVTRFIKPKNNTLMVKFDPAVPYAKNLMNRYTTFDESTIINPYRAYIRKAQYQFGWDWCPALPGCGIWRPIRLEGIKHATLDDIHIHTVECNQNYADIKIAVTLNTLAKKDFLCKLTITNERTGPIESTLTFKPGETSQSAVIHIEKPLLWWPAGYGKQNLYQLNTQLLSDREIVDSKEQRFGIRIIKLDRSLDKNGENFQFHVNGRAVFAKGANWIPASIFPGSVTETDYKDLLQAAADANINMLRVWGGGYYESNEFYRLCDELGLMVWQDFMFACSYYPDRTWFLKEVKNEAATTIKRLRNHASLALWCGNNEIDWMHNTGKLGKGKKFYGKAIYHKIIPDLVAEINSDTDYIPTTPLGKKNEFKIERFSATHQWQVWSGHRPVSSYLCPAENIPKFVTEFGMQAPPPMQTIKKFCPDNQLHIGSYQFEKHNYQLDGNSRLYRYVGNLFGSAKSIEQFVYLSQITQARALKTCVEHLRAHNLRNNGVLFWQFNDCCPALSWSAIDYIKKPKALYYYAKRFFSKLLVTAITEFDKPKANAQPTVKSLNAIVINNSDQPVTATLNCRLIDLHARLIDQVASPVAIGPFSNSPPLKLPKAIVSPDEPHNCALHLLLEKNGEKLTENLLLYLPDKYINWPKIQINTELKPVNENQWKLKLKADAIAKDLQITTGNNAKLTDNFIDLIPPSEYEIIITNQQHLESIEPQIQLRSITPAGN